ncbi:MAG: hypothetical protein AMJ53_14570 [Gammaproteobacteria bacterium SG8_11]|nr:MAG: hypothetical protein AMJ53_14570 [Gammaproteobacteria bacterium SG8_11]
MTLKPELPMSGEHIPRATIQQKSRISIVWLIPVVAVIIGAFLAYKAISEQGPTITITFKSAEGLQAGKTKIKYKDVEMGTVTSIELAPDLSHVLVTASLVHGTERFLKEKTRFWMVTARVAAGEVSGLGTLLSGAYIGMDPVLEGDRSREFTGLEIPPAITTNEPGGQYLLRSTSLGSLDIGSPVYYRKFRVGQVVSQELDSDGNEVNIKIFVHAAFQHLIRQNTRFWNAGGIDVKVGTDGLQVNTESLVSLLIGGIAFDTPSNLEAGTVAQEGQSFPLFASKDKAFEKTYVEVGYWLLYFNDSVRGLKPGAPVEFRGIQMGKVVDVKLEMDLDNADIRIPVLIEIERERLVPQEQLASLGERGTDITKVLVQKGLRAQLQSANLLTGQLKVELDFFPNAPAAEISTHGSYRVFPTVPAPLDEITTSITQVLQKLEKLPLEQIGKDLQATIQNAEKLTGSPELLESIRSLKVALAELEQTTISLNQNVTPSLQDTLLQSQKTLKAAETVFQNASPLEQQLGELLKEMQAASRSIRGFADYLERHPEALLKGK